MIRPTHARINQDALRSNIRLLHSLLDPEARMMAIVKADCYGHGIEHCLPVMLEEGIAMFGVATVEEGERLRAAGVARRIVVLPPPLRGQFDRYVEHDLEAVISDSETARALASVAAGLGRTLRAHLHVDTGMTRNGVAPEGAVELMRSTEELSGLDVVGVASHFATSDEIGGSFAAQQHSRFAGTLAALTDAGYTFEDIHLANSGGIFNVPGSHYTLVRPGLALYGYHPTREQQAASGLVPVMSLVSVVGGVKRVGPGVSVSYGRTWSSPAPTTIATIPIGYADGIMRALSGRMDVLIGGRRHPAVGRISMDEIMVDLGAETDVRPGDPVVLMGRDGEHSIDAWDLAEAALTIPYEICTNISSRVPRRGVDAAEPSTFSSIQ